VGVRARGEQRVELDLAIMDLPESLQRHLGQLREGNPLALTGLHPHCGGEGREGAPLPPCIALLA